MRKKLLFLTIVISIIYISCQKNQEDETGISEKLISAIVFRSADNPALAADVAGVITNDSIRFNFSQPIPFNNLIPTISFSGKSISPANRIAQDFTHPVTYTVTAEDGSKKGYIIAVNRPVTDAASLILGKWSIYRDSVRTANGHL